MGLKLSKEGLPLVRPPCLQFLGLVWGAWENPLPRSGSVLGDQLCLAEKRGLSGGSVD